MRKVVSWCEEALAADSQGSGRWKCSGIRGFFTTNTKHSCPQPEPEASPNPPLRKVAGAGSCRTSEGDVEWLEMQKKKRCKATGRTHTNEALKIKVTAFLIGASLTENKSV